MDKDIKSILEKLPVDLCSYFKTGQVNEIRIRAGTERAIHYNNKSVIVYDYIFTEQDIYNILIKLCDYTLSAYQNQLANGYITLPGGHRIGVGGIYSTDEGENVLVKPTSLVIRIANRCEYIYPEKLLQFSQGLLIAGPPHSGKTTLLKTICNNLDGERVICDERGEFSDCIRNCDVISGISKTDAIQQAVRSMNPQIIICDEIGSEKESIQMLSFMNTGIRFICSVHAENINQLWRKPNIRILFENKIFDKVAFLGFEKGIFFIREITDV